MSDEKNLGNRTYEIGQKWSLQRPYVDPIAETEIGFSVPLSFDKAFLFPLQPQAGLEITVDHFDNHQCPVCTIRLSKSARYCSNCGICLKVDMTFENSW